MNFRLAVMEDLMQLKEVYRRIIQCMNDDNLQVWDEIYPCEYFAEDIENERLYILEDDDKIAAAFALCNSNDGADSVKWEKNNAEALYIDRLGVNVDYLRRGIGSLMLDKAVEAAKERNAEYLRLFVVDINKPAINLYIKNGYKQVIGVYDEVIDEELTLHEYGFEIKTGR